MSLDSFDPTLQMPMNQPTGLDAGYANYMNPPGMGPMGIDTTLSNQPGGWSPNWAAAGAGAAKGAMSFQMPQGGGGQPLQLGGVAPAQSHLSNETLNMIRQKMEQENQQSMAQQGSYANTTNALIQGIQPSPQLLNQYNPFHPNYGG